jgi:hypothetical protein
VIAGAVALESTGIRAFAARGLRLVWRDNISGLPDLSRLIDLPSPDRRVPSLNKWRNRGLPAEKEEA